MTAIAVVDAPAVIAWSVAGWGIAVALIVTVVRRVARRVTIGALVTVEPWGVALARQLHRDARRIIFDPYRGITYVECVDRSIIRYRSRHDVALIAAPNHRPLAHRSCDPRRVRRTRRWCGAVTIVVVAAMTLVSVAVAETHATGHLATVIADRRLWWPTLAATAGHPGSLVAAVACGAVWVVALVPLRGMNVARLHLETRPETVGGRLTGR